MYIPVLSPESICNDHRIFVTWSDLFDTFAELTNSVTRLFWWWRLATILWPKGIQLTGWSTYYNKVSGTVFLVLCSLITRLYRVITQYLGNTLVCILSKRRKICVGINTWLTICRLWNRVMTASCITPWECNLYHLSIN